MTKGLMVERLNYIVEELGDIYLGMSDKYPRFFEKLENEVACFEGEEKEKESLTSVSRNVSIFIEKKEAFSSQNRDKETSLIETIDRELRKLSLIEEGIGGMEEGSEDLELISLNAMVSALKAGNNGGAFPYITRELQRVSRLSRENSNSIRMYGQNLDREYKALIDRVRKEQEETGKDIGNVYTSLEEVISRLNFYDGAFHDQCELLGEGIQKMRSPLHMILEEVQKHDIVRQSVNHIIISLEEIHETADESNLEDKLNNLKFACQVYELSRFIIDDIRESVNRSYEKFNGEKKDVEKIVHSLRIVMGDKIKEIGKDNIQDKIDSIRRSLSQYFSSHSDDLAHKEMSSDHFHDLIDELESGIAQYAKVLSAIRNIHVASRIEVVKLNRLENMENIIGNIDTTVSMMEDQLARIGEAVEEFRKASGSIITDFVSYFHLVRDQVQESLANLDPILDTIEHFRVSLNEHFSQFITVNQEFEGFNGLVSDHLIHMDTLIKEIDNISSSFDSRRKAHEEELEALLEDSDYSDWSLEGDRIKNLIDKFTIFIHKKAMTEGQDADQINLDSEQAQASEITLF